jgi:hypothetical protein
MVVVGMAQCSAEEEGVGPVSSTGLELAEAGGTRPTWDRGSGEAARWSPDTVQGDRGQTCLNQFKI